MKTPARPDFFMSPSGTRWVVMCYYSEDRMRRVWWPEVEDGEDIPPAINKRRCDILHTSILRGQSSDPVIHAQDDHVALMRVSDDEEGYPRLMMACLPLADMRAQKWRVVRPNFELGDPSRSYTIEGDECTVHQMHPTYAIMRWSFDFEDCSRREWTFPLWRWELCLAAIGPVSFEMMPQTHYAKENEI